MILRVFFRGGQGGQFAPPEIGFAPPDYCTNIIAYTAASSWEAYSAPPKILETLICPPWNICLKKSLVERAENVSKEAAAKEFWINMMASNYTFFLVDIGPGPCVTTWLAAISRVKGGVNYYCCTQAHFMK